MSSDSSSIDDKKDDTSGQTTQTKFKNFIANYSGSLLVTLGFSIIFIGTIGLYTTKIVQSKLLPIDLNSLPYINKKVELTTEEVNIDFVKEISFYGKSKNVLTQKAIFNKHSFINSFKDNSILYFFQYFSQNNDGLFSNCFYYLSNVYNNLICSNYTLINYIFSKYALLPEWLIVFSYGLFLIYVLLFICFFIFNWGATLIYLITLFPLVFTNFDKKTGSWQSFNIFDLLNFLKYPVAFFTFIIAIFFLCIMPVIISITSLISPLFATYKLKNSNKDKNFIDFLLSTIQ